MNRISSIEQYPSHPYRNCTAILSTMHGKAEAFTPPFEQILQVSFHTPEGIDTDVLGTFSGEVERTAPPVETLRRKIHLGLAHTNNTYGTGSEGSFGPHPVIPFVAQHHEVMMWIDRERDIEVIEHSLTYETNYDSLTVRAEDERLLPFLEKISFPSHAVIVRPNSSELAGHIFKGLRTEDDIRVAIKQCVTISQDGQALIQTDMRAHQNPTRMRVIRRLAEQLAKRLSARCPACHCPGWGIVDSLRGLPCGECGSPTSLVASYVYGCPKCEHQQTLLRADGLVVSPPVHCDRCNP